VRTVTLREAPDDSAFGWLSGHAHEVVIPLVATTFPRHRPRWPRRPVGREHGHLLGASTWLYVKLYGRPDRQNAILTNHLMGTNGRSGGSCAIAILNRTCGFGSSSATRTSSAQPLRASGPG
jgi:hypothetical protein